MSIADCRLIDLPRITDPQGNLTFIQSKEQVPFAIERVYYIYDIPGGSKRGGHAHKGLHQLIVPLSGSFDIMIDDGRATTTFHLNRPFRGLYVCPLIWREIDNFSSGSVCMVVASNAYDEDDYYRDYKDFTAALSTSAGEGPLSRAQARLP